MKTRFTYILTPCILLTLLAATTLRAEHRLRFDAMPDKSAVRIDGTSTLHDWTAKSPGIDGYIDFKVDLPKGAPTPAIREAIVRNPQVTVDVTIAARSLKSGKKDMDKKMYAALKTSKYPSITYELTSLCVAEDASADQQRFPVETTGNLTVAGTTRVLQIPMLLEVVDEHHLKITGQASFKMSDFNVKPPQAMFGMIKSGDKIDVRFEWNTARHGQ